MRLTRAEQRTAVAAAPGGRVAVRPTRVSRSARALAVAAAVALAGGVGGGCAGPNETGITPNLYENGFADPAEMFAKTRAPLQKPILSSISALDPSIDDPEDEFYNAVEIQPQDRQVVSRDYKIGRGDVVAVSVSGLGGGDFAPETVSNSVVSESGNINLRLIPPVKADGLTEGELQTAVADAYRRANILATAQVSVTVAEPRGRAFSILGAVNQPGQYFIQRSDFRMLDALVTAKDTLLTVDTVYVVRQVKEDPNSTPSSPQQPATDGQTPQQPTPAPGTGPTQPPPPTTVPVDPLAAPRGDAGPRSDVPLTLLQYPNNGGLAPASPGGSLGGGSGRGPNAGGQGTPTGVGGIGGGYGGGYGGGVGAGVGGLRGGGAFSPPSPSQVGSGGGFQFGSPPAGGETRTIRVPVAALRNGALEYNIVIRPGDLILVPQPVAGLYYMGGHIARPGVYSVNAQKVTIKQAVIAAGMLDGLAIPQRTELYRRIGAAREALVRIDIDAIFSGTQPDLFLKPNDVIQVGTNILAPFIAALRGGFRITYGFGFLYDRNFYDQFNNNNNGL